MKHLTRLFGIFALVAALCFAMAACDSVVVVGGGNEHQTTFIDSATLKDYLANASDGKTASTPIAIKIGGSQINMESLVYILRATGKYVALDLSDSTGMGTFASSSTSSTAGKDKIVSIVLPNSTTAIGDFAFRGCTNLASVAIPDSVVSIGNAAFASCTNLASVNIPNGITSIGNNAFFSCSSLTAITVDSANTAYTSTDGVLYNKDKSILVAYPAGKKATSFSIPNGVTSIGNNAFSSCSNLASVSIPNSVTSIGDWAFSACYNLASVDIPNSVTSIGYNAFSACSNLASVTIGSGVTSIGDGAFNGDLRDKYFADGGGAGTYTRSGVGISSTWMKRSY